MAQTVAEEYKSSLNDLNFNSKPHINMLTMLAEENIRHASVIADTIVHHINTVKPELKLPGLYLVDSIIKNIGGQYLKLFSQHLISLFSSVFEKVDEGTRSLMFKLRQTWNNILPNKTLYGLDVQIRKLDPAWPVTAKPVIKPVQGIHINPRFLGGTTSVENPAMTALKKEESTSNVFKKEETLQPAVPKKEEKETKQVQDEALKRTSASKEKPNILEKKLELSTKKKADLVTARESLLQNFKQKMLELSRLNGWKLFEAGESHLSSVV